MRRDSSSPHGHDENGANQQKEQGGGSQLLDAEADELQSGGDADHGGTLGQRKSRDDTPATGHSVRRWATRLVTPSRYSRRPSMTMPMALRATS